MLVSMLVSMVGCDMNGEWLLLSWCMWVGLLGVNVLVLLMKCCCSVGRIM